MNLSEGSKDNIIAYAVLMQPVLVILQFLMIYVYNMSEEATTLDLQPKIILIL